MATLEFVVAVTNIADTPPVFISAPPITRMPQTALPGDFVLALVAKDGDAGPGRPIRWNLAHRYAIFLCSLDVEI